MESPFQIIFPLIAVVIVFSIWLLTIRYFLVPLFFMPKLNSSETFEFLENKNLKFIEKRELNKLEKELNPYNYKKRFSLKKIFSERTEYIVVGFSESKKEYYFFWLELTQWFFLYMKFFFEILIGQKIEKSRNLIFKEITENQILTELKKDYETKAILITDKCPACQNAISDKIPECPNCGLNLVA